MKSHIWHPNLVRFVAHEFALPLTSIHGPAHWARVRNNGLRLANINGADTQVIELFALFHDSCRENDWDDPGHGSRGADLLAFCYYEEKLLPLDEEIIHQAMIACDHHTDGESHWDLGVATCWDADRLDLWRAGIIPDPDRLCTDAARQPEEINRAIVNSDAWLQKRQFLCE